MKPLCYALLFSFLLIFYSACGNKGQHPKTSVATDSSAVTLESINASLREKPGNADLYQIRAKYFIDKKDLNAALEDMKRVLNIDSSKADYYLTLADIYFMMNKTGYSKAALIRCHMLDQKNPACIMKLAELYFYVRKYQESLNYLDEALKIDQNNAKAYFMKGMNFKESGDTAKALSSMQTAVEQDNTYYNAYVQLGLLCAAQHNRLAEDYYTNALRIRPNSTEALYDFGKLFQDEGNYPKAVEIYNRLLKVDKTFFDAQYNLGVIAADNKDYKEAIHCFSDAIGIDPKQAKGYYGRGYCYQQMGDVQNAAADYRYTLTLSPDYVLAKEGLKQMKIY
jgi:tetratricopeptide (TPR) repeat protein